MYRACRAWGKREASELEDCAVRVALEWFCREESEAESEAGGGCWKGKWVGKEARIRTSRTRQSLPPL